MRLWDNIMRSTIATGFTNLRLKYPGEDGLLFKGLSLSVRQGEKVLLLGPSGCGKSTILQVLSGLVPRSVELPMKADELIVPERSGYVFQDPDSQFCMPYVDEELAFVMENLCVPREDMPAGIKHNLARVGLDLKEEHTLIQDLSQGMKQRLAIASVLALEPDVLFLDEPTALLDQEGTTGVWDTIKQTSTNQTLIIVEHKIDEIIDWVDRVIVFTPEGTILGEGNPDDVFRKYKEQLIQYGIWYPAVWMDYVARREINRLSDADMNHRQNQPLIHMEGFRGLRGGAVKIEVERADVHAGEWISIVGENGAGKSSLLLAIMKLIQTDGLCVVSGNELKKVEQLARHIAFVFQNPEFQFVTHTVEDEVAYSLKWESMGMEERGCIVDHTLDRFDLNAYRLRHPYQLSMGQKRRLSVAVSLIRGQKLLLLDEPTFGLDARNTFAMLERLEQMREQGTTILMVTHDDQIVQHFSTRVWTIQQGSLVMDSVKRGMLPYAANLPLP
jgi:energy-coupling factor transporter ATP-binding protein EcfA2